MRGWGVGGVAIKEVSAVGSGISLKKKKNTWWSQRDQEKFQCGLRHGRPQDSANLEGKKKSQTVEEGKKRYV